MRLLTLAASPPVVGSTNSAMLLMVNRLIGGLRLGGSPLTAVSRKGMTIQAAIIRLRMRRFSRTTSRLTSASGQAAYIGFIATGSCAQEGSASARLWIAQEQSDL